MVSALGFSRSESKLNFRRSLESGLFLPREERQARLISRTAAGMKSGVWSLVESLPLCCFL